MLVEKTIAAAKQKGLDRIVLGGGVSANERLRKLMSSKCSEDGIELFLPAQENCTDNAAMIAFSGLKRFQSGMIGSLDDDVFSRSHLGQ